MTAKENPRPALGAPARGTNEEQHDYTISRIACTLAELEETVRLVWELNETYQRPGGETSATIYASNSSAMVHIVGFDAFDEAITLGVYQSSTMDDSEEVIHDPHFEIARKQLRQALYLEWRNRERE